MDIVTASMRRPFTVLTAVAAVLIGGGLAWSRMTFDAFPDLNLPVIHVSQPYGGMDAARMEGLLTNYYEYHFLYINGIRHVESRNAQGLALMKLSFHPGTNMAEAMAETVAAVNRARAAMPPGTVPPIVRRFDAGSVPVGFLTLSSETRTIGEIQDQALFRVRPMFAALPGVSAPPPFGGSQRAIVVRLLPDRARALGLTPDEVVSALAENNVIGPSGHLRIDDRMPIVTLNSPARGVEELGGVALRPGSTPAIHLRDVATIEDATDIVTGYALVNGRRAVYIPVTKRADASTLEVVASVRAALPEMRAALPDDIRVGFEFDQSPTVRRALGGLAAEGALGAALIGLMVLLFLRDGRAALIVVLNIPAALAAALLALWLTGQSVNLMTLAGLAMAVGILVDEAAVAVENIHARRERGDSAPRAAKIGTLETVTPRLLAMLCVVGVFSPAFLMQGAARSLFAPLAMAVGFAMFASYALSSSLVPVLSAWLGGGDDRGRGAGANGGGPGRYRLDGARRALAGRAGRLIRWRWAVWPAYAGVCFAILAGVGAGLDQEIFPRVDAGRFMMRLRAPAGTRMERTEEIALRALGIVEEEVGGRGNVEVSVGYVGMIPSSFPIHAIYEWMGGPEEAVLRVATRAGAVEDMEGLKTRLRGRLAREVPEALVSFEPADIVSDVMSFGARTPIEVAVSGPDFARTREHAERIRGELARLPELRDARIAQTLDYPAIRVDVDREKAGAAGVTVGEVARSLVAATSSSRFTTPIHWPDPKTGIGYQIQLEVPPELMNDAEALETLPIRSFEGGAILTRDVASVTPGSVPGSLDRYNMKRMVTVTANLAGRDLGGAKRAIVEAIARAGEPPRGATVETRGQLAPWGEIRSSLGWGFAFAIGAILLLLTAAFQSPSLAIASLGSIPAALAGATLALWATGTSLNLQSALGTIMAMGVATANAILLIGRAERLRVEGEPAERAGALAASSRLRPILMTSGAMILGMTPLAIGFGEAGEQTAPLGRAVVGGLAAATPTTLFLLPGLFAIARGRARRTSASLDPDDPESRFARVGSGRIGNGSEGATGTGAVGIAGSVSGRG